jgi:hypothetical protein
VHISRGGFPQIRDVMCRSVTARSKELYSPARTLRSWVRIPLKTWMSILCALILGLCCSVCRQRPCDWLIPHPRSPTDCAWDQETEERPSPIYLLRVSNC